MAYLDNSGNIILDVVLTDEGRRRLALGDGSFKIDKYAFGDDEINYELYNPSAATGQEDLQILQTPILEAFTNNMSSMKSTLMNLSRNDHLYLPVLKLNTVNTSGRYKQFGSLGMFMVACDKNTQDNSSTTPSGQSASSVALDPTTGLTRDGFLLGASPTLGGGVIRVDAGVDNTGMPSTTPLTDPALTEVSYEIKIDSRLGSIVSDQGIPISWVAVDDDHVATYVVGASTNSASATTIASFVAQNTDTTSWPSAEQVIAGARSSILTFKIASSQNLRSSFHLFDLIGSAGEMASPANITGTTGTNNIKFIDSVVRVTGQLTGYSIDIPVRFVKNI